MIESVSVPSLELEISWKIRSTLIGFSDYCFFYWDWVDFFLLSVFSFLIGLEPSEILLMDFVILSFLDSFDAYVIVNRGEKLVNEDNGWAGS